MASNDGSGRSADPEQGGQLVGNRPFSDIQHPVLGQCQIQNADIQAQPSSSGQDQESRCNPYRGR